MAEGTQTKRKPGKAGRPDVERARLARPSVPPPTRATRNFAQKRARITHRRLIEAAAEVFAESGFDDAQTPDIARRAGVSVGTFYRYFADKRQVFIEMIEIHLEAAYHRVMDRLTPDAFGAARTPPDRRATVDLVLDGLFQNAAENPALHRVFLAMSLRDSEVANIRFEFEEKSRVALAALIEQVVPRERIPDPRAAAQVIQVAAQEVAMATYDSHGRSPSVDAEAVRNALADMMYRYVFGTEEVPPASG